MFKTVSCLLVARVVCAVSKVTWFCKTGCIFFFPRQWARWRAISLPPRLTVVGSGALITPTLPTLRPFFDCCIYHRAVVLYIMVIGKWMSSTGLMCIPCHTFQSFIKIKIQLSAQWTPVDAWLYLRYGNCCFQLSWSRKCFAMYL